MATEFNLGHALNGSIRRLHHIQRYSSMPVVRPESVSTHSWQAAFIGLLVAYDLNERKPHTVDAGEVVKRCILHDISEAMSGDIIRVYKYSSHQMREACTNADNTNTYQLTREFGDDVGDHIFLKWQDAKDDTLEGDVVRLADVVCVVTYCVEEWYLGNRRLDVVLRGTFEEIAWPMRDHRHLGRYIHQLFPNGVYSDAYDFDSSWVRTWRQGKEGTHEP